MLFHIKQFTLAASMLFCLGITSVAPLSAREPFGAEDLGSESRVPSIPEPMVYDLVRSLGARRGELEANVLAEFPIGGTSSSTTGFDPIGLAPASNDRGGIEWAAEIEVALWDGLAVEFEFPYENSHFEAYKFAAQWTLGTALDDQFIDGLQVIVEPDIHFEVWELTFLYLAGMQFNGHWSALGMIGLRPEIEEGDGVEHVDGIANLTLFRDISHCTTLGLESNFAYGESDRTTFLLIPQVDHEFTDSLEVQFGGGVGFSRGETHPLVAVRLIYSR